MKTVKCPKCGQKIKLQPKPGEPGRLIGNCKCNPAGPVIETNAAPVQGKHESAGARDAGQESDE